MTYVMKNKYYILPALTFSLLASCSLFEKPQIFNPHDVRPESMSDEEVFGIGGLDGGGSFVPKFTTGDIEDIHANVVFAPEDPTVAFNPIEGGGAAPQTSTWTKNYRKAIQKARQEGKPLLVWFSSSQGSVASSHLNSELFSRGDFNTWVSKNFSTLLIDKSDSNRHEDNNDTRNEKKRYYRDMSERFGIHGTPEVLVVDFQGEVFARYRGYSKGEANYYWGRLKVAHQGAMLSYGQWREKMEKRGYRVWHSADGEQKVFAKMKSKQDDSIDLITPEGKKYSRKIASFSSEDKRWIVANE